MPLIPTRLAVSNPKQHSGSELRHWQAVRGGVIPAQWRILIGWLPAHDRSPNLLILDPWNPACLVPTLQQHIRHRVQPLLLLFLPYSCAHHSFVTPQPFARSQQTSGSVKRARWCSSFLSLTQFPFPISVEKLKHPQPCFSIIRLGLAVISSMADTRIHIL